MSNGDVLWAWIAGALVSLALLFALSHQDRPPYSTAQDDMFTYEMGLGGGRHAQDPREREGWERTGAAPPRHAADAFPYDAFPYDAFTDDPYGALDLMERTVPIALPPLLSLGGRPAVAEDPSMLDPEHDPRKTPP